MDLISVITIAIFAIGAFFLARYLTGVEKSELELEALRPLQPAVTEPQAVLVDHSSQQFNSAIAETESVQIVPSVTLSLNGMKSVNPDWPSPPSVRLAVKQLRKPAAIKPAAIKPAAIKPAAIKPAAIKPGSSISAVPPKPAAKKKLVSTTVTAVNSPVNLQIASPVISTTVKKQNRRYRKKPSQGVIEQRVEATTGTAIAKKKVQK